jgi:hypothetical protein
MYVMIRNQNDYELLKQVILDYEDIIVNIEDMQQQFSFTQQEKRVSNVISLMQTLQR